MDKNLKKSIEAFFELIIDEAEKNDEFASAINKIFIDNSIKLRVNENKGTKRGTNRRDKAVIDPIKLAEEGNLSTEVLEPLTDKELKDIIADYGMDPSKLAMKWKNKNRLIQLILDTSFRRASKGDAFRS